MLGGAAWPQQQQATASKSDLALPQSPQAEPGCAEPDTLAGRAIEVGSQGGLNLGLKTYRQTLDLKKNEVVLTFDDGPNPVTTTRVLDALKRECVKATFFLIGQNAEKYPTLVRREVQEGHTVAHHSWSHPAITLRGLTEDDGIAEINRGIEAVDRAGWGSTQIDREPRVPFFRFPGFADTQPLLKRLASRNIAVFGADVWASDWRPMSPEAQLRLLLQRLDEAQSGIILLHDTRPQTADMLPVLLRELRARRYKIVHLVPGAARPDTRPAPEQWRSETEPIVERVLSRLRSPPAGRNSEPHSALRQPSVKQLPVLEREPSDDSLSPERP